MPLYEMRCPNCNAEYEVAMRMSEVGEREIPCEDCQTIIVRHYRTPVSFAMPADFTYDGKIKTSGRTLKEQQRVPVNIIDENPDGSYKVTRIGSKKDIDND